MYNYPTYSKTLFLQTLVGFVLIHIFFSEWYQEMDAIILYDLVTYPLTIYIT